MTGLPTFTAVCRNCAAALHGPFCSACGQGHRHERLRLADWFGDVIDGIANFESRILHTIVDLTRRPGRMVREYVDGRQIRWLVRFLLLRVIAALLGVLIFGAALNIALVLPGRTWSA